MRRLILFVICVFAVITMGQLKISGRKPAAINGHVPSIWSGVDTDISGSGSEPDGWSPASGALTFLDSFSIEAGYYYPTLSAIPGTKVVVIGHNTFGGNRQLETREISDTDTIGPVIDTWTISHDMDTDYLAYSQTFSMYPDSDPTRQLTVVPRSGQDIAGLDEDHHILEVFSTSISLGGAITKLRRDSLYLAFHTSPYGWKSFSAKNIRDSLYVVFTNHSADGIGRITWTSFVATWDTIYQNQKIYSASTTGYACELDLILHKDYDLPSDSSALVLAYAGSGNDGYLLKTYMTDADTISPRYDTWEYQPGNGQSPGIVHYPNSEKFSVGVKGTDVSNQWFVVFTGDTISDTFTKSYVDYWTMNTEEGYGDFEYVVRSDSLCYSIHYGGNNNLYSHVVGYRLTSDAIVESFFGADTLTKDTSFNYPDLEYVREGLFLTVSGDATGGMLVLYRMD